MIEVPIIGILSEEEAVSKLTSGAEQVYNAVSATMGSAGNFVMYDDVDELYPVATKDGVSVARQINLSCNAENMGAMQLIQAANRQLKDSGDGTTLTVVLAYHIYMEGLKAINSKVNPKRLRDGIEIGIQEVIKSLVQLSIPLEEIKDGLKYIATISMNGNAEFGAMIAEAIERVGKFGLVTYEKSKNNKHSIEYKQGYEWAIGAQYSDFYNYNGFLSLSNVSVVVSETPLAWGQELASIEGAVGKNPLVIVCADVTGEAMKEIIANKKEGYEWYVVPVNGLGTEQSYLLEDIAALSGATVISEKHGLYWNQVKSDHIGKLKKLDSNAGRTVIIGDEKLASGRVAQLKGVIENLEEGLDKELVEKSIAKLTGGIAVIKVGGNSETEQKEIMDRVDDAIKASMSAKEEGIVNGGGVALLQAKAMTAIFPVDKDTMRGVEIVLDAIVAPIRKIISNAGFSPELIIEEILTSSVFGYDINRGKIDDPMIDKGIIDPTKVIRTALLNAASVAGMMLQTSVMLVNK